MAQYNINNIMVSSDVKDFNRFLDERRKLMDSVKICSQFL